MSSPGAANRSRLRILWIPHNAWGPGRYQRDQYFIDRLLPQHEVHVLTWSNFLPHSIANLCNPGTYMRALRSFKTQYGALSVHHVPRVPSVLSLGARSAFAPTAINRGLLLSAVRRILRREKIHVVISGQPIDQRCLSVPLVLDYVDWSGFATTNDERCLAHAQCVLCVSQLLQKEARRHNSSTFLLPNGADVNWMRGGNAERVRHKHGLMENVVVSLIGLTSSPRFYFLDAVMEAQKRVPSIRCLLVGHSDAILQRAKALNRNGKMFLCVGPVDYQEVRDYFAASDVGLYPADEDIYFQAASPIKVFEYSAAGKPVVLSRLVEMQSLGWQNLFFAAPDAPAFADAIVDASLASRSGLSMPANISSFDWSALTARLESVLQQVCGGSRLRESRS